MSRPPRRKGAAPGAAARRRLALHALDDAHDLPPQPHEPRVGGPLLARSGGLVWAALSWPAWSRLTRASAAIVAPASSSWDSSWGRSPQGPPRTKTRARRILPLGRRPAPARLTSSAGSCSRRAAPPAAVLALLLVCPYAINHKWMNSDQIGQEYWQ